MIELYKPSLAELDFRKELLQDEATMAFNHAYGGTIAFKDIKTWYNKWLVKDDEHFYRYVKNNDLFVGEVAYYLEEDKWLISIIIKDEFRKRGYAKKALSLLFEECKAHDIREIYDMIAVDNPSIDLFLDLGFTIIDRNEEYILIKKALD